MRTHVQYDDQSVPAVEETLEAGKGAAARYDKFIKTLNGCTSVSFTASGQTVKGTVGAMSFPTVEDSSSAYAMNFTIEGESVGLHVVLFRVGQYDGDIEYVDFSPDTSTMQAFAQEAAAKVEGKTGTTGNTGTTSTTYVNPLTPQPTETDGNCLPGYVSKPSATAPYFTCAQGGTP